MECNNGSRNLEPPLMVVLLSIYFNEWKTLLALTFEGAELIYIYFIVYKIIRYNRRANVGDFEHFDEVYQIPVL